MTPEERSAALARIADEVRTCQRCRLATTRTRAVPGEGSPDTEVVFVGEGPGQNEDQQGRPFVGAAGRFLDELITTVGWRRRDVFITNVVKCRPPGNRDPEPDEMAACAPYLRRQLEVLDPALVVTLGRFSLGTFMPGAKISQVHGTIRPVDPGTGARAARAFAMYHPAAALRATNLKETMRDDMSRIPQALIDARAARPAPEADEPAAVPTAPPDALEPMAEPATPELQPMAEPAPAPEPATAPMTDPIPVDLIEPEMAAPDPPEDLEDLDQLTTLEVVIAPDRSPETDQMRLF